MILRTCYRAINSLNLGLYRAWRTIDLFNAIYFIFMGHFWVYLKDIIVAGEKKLEL